MPDKKANKNYNISITDKEEIVKESISEITKQFSEKIELVGKQIFENVNKQYQEEIMALKLEITQLKESQDFLSNKYDELKTEFKQLNVINSKQEKELCNLKKNSIELKIMPIMKEKNLITWNNMEEDKILNLLAFLMKKMKT